MLFFRSSYRNPKEPPHGVRYEELTTQLRCAETARRDHTWEVWAAALPGKLSLVDRSYSVLACRTFFPAVRSLP